MSTGMTWEAVREQFDIPRVTAIQEYWKMYPPVHQLVAAYFGYAKASPKTSASLDELIQFIPEVKR